MDSGFILQQDSRFQKLGSNTQYSGFQKQKISWIPESGLPYMGRLLRYSELRTHLQHPCAVLAERGRIVI